jgi:hypothetical protein
MCTHRTAVDQCRGLSVEMLLIVMRPCTVVAYGNHVAHYRVSHALLRHMKGVMFAGAKVPTTSGCTTDAVLFDATTGSFTTLSDVLSFARAELAAASSTSGTIALFGGGDFRAHDFFYHARVSRFSAKLIPCLPTFHARTSYII